MFRLWKFGGLLPFKILLKAKLGYADLILRPEHRRLWVGALLGDGGAAYLYFIGVSPLLCTRTLKV